MSLLEQDAQWLIDCQDAVWRAEWTRRDVCRSLVKARSEDHIRALREVTGISEDKVRRWAEEAGLVPPEDRSLDISPQTQVYRARRRAKT